MTHIVIGSSSSISNALNELSGADFIGRSNPFKLPKWTQGLSLDTEDNIRTALNLLLQALERDPSINSLVQLQGTSSEDWDKSLMVNLISTAKIAETFAKKLSSQKQKGSITLIGSASAYLGGKLPYASTKAALFGLMNALNKSYGENIRTNLIVPGVFEGAMTKDWSTDKKQTVLSNTYSKRLAKPTEIASVINFLSQNSYMCGSVLNLSSGAINIQ